MFRATTAAARLRGLRSSALGGLRSGSAVPNVGSSVGAPPFPAVDLSDVTAKPGGDAKPRCPDAPTKADVSAKHWEAEWSTEHLMAESKEHAMATWGPGAPLRGAPLFVRAEGPYLYDSDGKQYMEWTSQAVCTNLGQTMPEPVKQAMLKQAETLPFVYSGFCNSIPRIRLASLLSEILPGDLTGFLFPTSGAEANEAAIRMARRFTGKTKIINQYRSYHGGTQASIQATGDFRRNFAEGRGGDGAPGFIKTMNPTDTHIFAFATTDEERCAKALGYLEEQILCEGPHTIAAIQLESLTGSAGVYINPPGYMEGVRKLCDKYDILYLADEVMVGFGRTGKMWGFQHYDVLPDIVTSAKGLSGAWMPVSMLCCRQKIKDFFETNPLGWGSTFHAHPMNTAVAYECVKFMLETDLVGHVQRNVAPVMASELERLSQKFESVSSSYRHVGGFGCLDLLDPRTGHPIQEFSGANCSNTDAVNTFKAKLRENGLVGFVRPPKFHCAPPLIIEPDQLKDGFARAERALEAYDKSF